MQNKIKANIGDKFIDDDGNIGIVGILWDNGDFTIESVVMHVNPKPMKLKKAKREFQCSFCGQIIGTNDSGVAIIKCQNQVCVLDKMLCEHSDSNQKQTIFACPRCAFQLKNSIIKINFDYIEKEVNYDCNCK